MTNATELSRRTLLASLAGGAAATLPVLAVAHASSPEGDDEHLFALCRLWAKWDEQYKKLSDQITQLEEQGDSSEWDARERMSELVGQGHDLWEAIGRIRATTLKGVLAKAIITSGACPEGIDEEATRFGGGIEPHSMAVTLVRDLLAMAEQGGVVS